MLKLAAPASCDFALCFSIWPEPSCVDMAVAAGEKLVLAIGVFMTGEKFFTFSKCLIKLGFVHRHQILIGHVIYKIKVDVRQSTLSLRLHSLSRISDTFYIPKVFLHFRIHQTYLTCFQFVEFVHFDDTSPWLVFICSKHILAGNFNQEFRFSHHVGFSWTFYLVNFSHIFSKCL